MKTRTISGIIIILIVVPVLLFAGDYMKYVVMLLSILAIKEMLDLRESYKKIPLFIKLAVYFFVMYITLSKVITFETFDFVFDNTEIISLVFVMFLPTVIYQDIEKYSINDASFVLFSTFYIGIAFNSFLLTYTNNLHLVIYCILISVLTDVFAYFGGVLFGKHKLIPTISPKKTWEGAIIGAICGSIIPTIYLMIVEVTDFSVFFFLVLSLVLSIIGQFGDLFSSAIKRRYKVKDFGDLIPGHGGILDRIDNLMFVFSGFILLVNLYSEVILTILGAN